MVVSRKLSPNLVVVNEELQKQTVALFNNEQGLLPTQKLYKYVEFMCRDKYQSKLTSFLYSAITAYCEDYLGKFKDQVQGSADNRQTLELYNEFHLNLSLMSRKLTKIYLYLDRTYLLLHPLKSTIVEYFDEFIVVKVWKDSRLGDQMFNALNEVLNSYRQSSDESLQFLIVNTMQKVNQLAASLDLYSKLYETSSTFFVLLNTIYYKEYKGVELFDKIYLTIRNENELWETIDQTKVSEFKKIILKNLLFSNFTTEGDIIMNSLLTEKQFSKFYILLQIIENDKEPGKSINKQKLMKCWEEYIFKYITSIIEKYIQDDQLIPVLIKSRNQLNEVLKTFLSSDQNADIKLRDAFQAAVTSSHNNTSSIIYTKLLSVLNNFFKTASAEGTDQEELALNDFLLILKSIKSKESFIKDYQRDLSKRLILSTTNNISLELKFIEILKTEIDTEILSTISTMFKDIEKSKALETKFARISRTKPPLLKFTPLILDSKCWPSTKTKAQLPTELEDILNEFETQYINDNDKQILEWSSVQSFMTIEWNLPNNITKQLEVSTLHGIVLLLFSNTSKLTYNDIKSKTKLDSMRLTGILHSLSKGKFKVLSKDDDGFYSINKSFQSRRDTIKIKSAKVMLAKKSSDADIENNNNSDADDLDMNEEDSKKAQDESIQAFIVRLLKFEMNVTHNDLVKRCQEKYIVETTTIKRIIQSLISQEYISRDIENQGYKYIPA